MSGRIAKLVRSRSRHPKTLERDALLELILQHPVDMPACSYCESRGLSSCQVGEDGERCTECIRHNQSRCDVKGLSASQLRNIGAQHSKVDAELDAAEEELELAAVRVRRLRKQKKLWFEKMVRAIRRGIDSVEELERVEKEEAEAAARKAALEEAERSKTPSPVLPDDFAGLWEDVYPNVALSPSVLADFGLVSGGNPQGGPGNSSSS